MDTNFVILRTAKLKTYGSIAASGEHTFRERPTQNADLARTHLNDNRGALSAAELVAAVRERVEVAERAAKDPVLCIEYLITASPEALAEKSPAERQAYFDDALRWLEARHGKENIVCSSLQRDESTEHLAVYAVPLVEREAKQRKRSVIVGKGEDGKPIRETRLFTEPGGTLLSAKEFLGGREKLTRMQTEFAAQVGQQHGLQRGLEGSKRVHRRNADIGAMTADRMSLTGQVKALEKEIERLTQQVATGDGALAKVQRKFEHQQRLNGENFHHINRIEAELKAARATEAALRGQLDQALLQGAEAVRQAKLSAGQVAALGERLAKQGAELVAVQQAKAELERQLATTRGELAEVRQEAKEALLSLNGERDARVAAERALGALQATAKAPAAPEPGLGQIVEKQEPRRPATVEEAQRAAIREEEKRLGWKIGKASPEAAEIRKRVRAEWNAAQVQQEVTPVVAEKPQEVRQSRSIPLPPKGRGGR